MYIEIPYAGEILNIEFPDNTTILSGKEHTSISSEEVYNRIEVAYRNIQTLFRGNKVLVIINDITRRVPSERILKILLDFIPIENLEILIATGTHEISTGECLENILGSLYHELASRTSYHNCDNSDNLHSVGSTSRGTPVEVNRKFLHAEAVICINSVEPHFFAGFTGGRKSIIPGLAGRKTVIANHSLAKEEEAKSLSLEDNPVHLDLMEAVDMVIKAPVFSIQLVLNRNSEIIDLFCGDIKDSFHDAVKLARDIYSIPIEKTFDIVFAIGERPLDVNLYQLQKAQEHGAEAVSDGGILVVVGACEEGTGSPYFVNLADEYPYPADALSEAALIDKRFGIHKLIKTARRLNKIKIWYVTKLDDNVVRKVYFEPKCSPQEALNEALEYFGDKASIAVLRDACFLVPVKD
jgi:nickel-dependent lactate racemase